MAKHFVLSLICFSLSAALLLAGFHSVAVAQVAVEYGIIGSKPPPASPDPGKGISKKVRTGAKQAPSSDKGYKRQTASQPKAGSKTGGPLIIERRGDQYERVN